MSRLALVTDQASLPIDYDMALLLDACRAADLVAEVCDWEDPTVDWSGFDAVLLRSPWSYVDRLPVFLAWCERVAAVTDLHNPLPVVRWSLDKLYMADLAAHGVPVVPSTYVRPGSDPSAAVRQFLDGHPEAAEFVVKPTVGAYSKDVQRFSRSHAPTATAHVARLHSAGLVALLQPYLESVDRDGETDLIYFGGVYSHAIRKSPMLMPDGTVNVPTFESRTPRVAEDDERAVASAALAAAGARLGLDRPLVYARVDVIRGFDGAPIVLELELCEPSLNLPFTDHGPTRFAEAIAGRLGISAR
ncbi:RimK family alpha-L-glutamate ligase [Micromonospora sp. NPDC048935]|uniref:ATP-grasp domain-containing protein n=1 Tax=Micromonospora sp. NPDC048935 TaxID=3364262 RepID=UPI003719BA46